MADDCSHAMVQQVTIEAIDATTVTFSTRSASRTGNPDDSLRRRFTTPLAEVWTQPIAGAPPPVAMVPGATGTLFLSRAGWTATSPDGARIFGAGTPLPVFKWPWCAAPPRIVSQLAVVPTSIVVHGHLRGREDFVDVELLGPEAAPRQVIAWNNALDLELQLTAHGAQRLGLGDAPIAVKLWPTSILVAGSPTADRTVAGVVDLLDPEQAGWSQHFELGEPGAPIALSLTLDGVSAFHVAPQRAGAGAGLAGALAS
jgi:hypothetical protein